MKKGTILFPLFTSRQTKSNQPQKQSQTGRVKTKQSSSLLKLISEDIERTRQLRKQKSNQIDSLFRPNSNRDKANSFRRIKEISSDQKPQKMPSLQIRKIAKTQTFRTLIPQLKSTKAGAKPTQLSISEKQNPKNIRFSGETVIVVQKRKEFSKINEQLIYDRRQNYLNSKFNDRVSRLNSITKQNKQIYDRINSQQSHYSNQELNKSYQSNASISQRLSNSKISRRSRLSMSSQRQVSSSRCSIASKKSTKSIKYHEGFHSKQALKGKNANKKLIRIESKNINELKAQQFQNFATLFSSTNHTSLKAKRTQSITARKQKDSCELKQNVENMVSSTQKMSLKLKGSQSLLPSLVNFGKNKQSKQNKHQHSSQRISLIRKQILSAIDENVKGVRQNYGDSLHKIVEQPTISVRNILNQNFRR